MSAVPVRARLRSRGNWPASILVPYLHAVDDHQTANARVLQQAGAAQLVPTGVSFREQIAEVLHQMA